MAEPTTQTATPPDTGQQVLPVTTDAPPDSGGNPDDDDAQDDDGQLDEHARRQVNTERRHRRAAERKTTELSKTVEGLQAKVKQFEDATKTEEQRRAEALTAAQAETAAARQETADARLELLRYQVGTEKQLSAALIPRLMGNTREELEADADRLVAEVAGTAGPRGPRRPAPDPRLGRAGDGKVSTEDQFAAAMKRIL